MFYKLDMNLILTRIVLKDSKLAENSQSYVNLTDGHIL